MFLFGSAVIMTIPSVMIFLSVALKAKVNRLVNIIVGSLYTLMIIGTIIAGIILPGQTWPYYYFFNAFEITLTSLIIWHAIKWPKTQ